MWNKIPEEQFGFMPDCSDTQMQVISRTIISLFISTCGYFVFVFYFDGVIIAAQCTATFLRSIVLPRI